MTTNYESGRVALFLCMRMCCLHDGRDIDRLLPPDGAYGVCTPNHLAAALGLAGLEATVIRTHAVGDTVHAAICEGSLAIVLAGLHTTAEQQRWLVGFDCGQHIPEFVGGAFEGIWMRPEPAHFCPIVIVVRGTLADRTERESGDRWHIVD